MQRIMRPQRLVGSAILEGLFSDRLILRNFVLIQKPREPVIRYGSVSECSIRTPVANSLPGRLASVVYGLSFTAAQLVPVHATLTSWPRVQRQQTPCKADPQPRQSQHARSRRRGCAQSRARRHTETNGRRRNRGGQQRREGNGRRQGHVRSLFPRRPGLLKTDRDRSSRNETRRSVPVCRVHGTAPIRCGHRRSIADRD